MDDLGQPTSFLALENGADVYSADGEKVGHVSEVRADTTADIFDGILISKGMISMSSTRHFVSADQVDEIFEQGVRLKLNADIVNELGENAAS